VTVRVLFFAYLRERCGVRETAVELPEGARVEDVWEELCRRYDRLAGQRLRFALNQVYVDTAHPLHEDDEIALIPPVSGGGGQPSARNPGAIAGRYCVPRGA
jgi:molybdopterin converting factor subunit 1